MSGGWRTSSFSNGTNCVQVGWRKSSASMSNSHCVEVARGPAVLVRDSADRGGPVLAFTPEGWGAFLGGVRGSL